jgi:hypothetical protein
MKMQYKPLSIIILSALYALAPLAKILFFVGFYQTDFLYTAGKILSDYPAWKLINFFILPWVASVAIYRVKNWSFKVFLLVEILMLAGNLHYLKWLYRVNFMPMFYFYIGITCSTFLATCYFLLPAIKLAYFDPRSRWWEAQPRYDFSHPLNLKMLSAESLPLLTSIHNISEGGLFISAMQSLPIDQLFSLQFKHLDQDVLLQGRLLYQTQYLGRHGYGLQFCHLNKKEKKQIKQIIHFLEKNNVPRRPPKRSLFSLTSKKAA